MDTENFCPNELRKQKDESPCIVDNEEPIIYVILDPDHYKNGILTHAAFSKSKLKEGSLSVSRANYTTADQIKKSVIDPQLIRNKERKFVGVIKATCRDIRSIKMNNETTRAICVIDDGTENDSAHAHLSFSEKAKIASKNEQQSIRGNLMLMFQTNPVGLDEIFT